MPTRVYPDWVINSNWTVIYDWMVGDAVNGPKLTKALESAWRYCGGKESDDQSIPNLTGPQDHEGLRNQM